MRKGLGLILCLTVILSAYGAKASAVHQEYATAWHDALDSNPKNYSPQSLAGESRKIPENPPGYRIAIATEDDIWFLSHDVDDLNYNYIMFSFTNTEPTQAFCNWRISVESLADIYLYYWDGDSWEDLDQNEGGLNPDSRNVDVTDYYGAEQLLILAVGATPQSGDDDIYCDLCDLKVNP